MDTLNQAFKDGTVFIPEVLAAARAMNAAVLFLEPHLAETDQRAGGKILIGTVKGDLHDIGKNMVATMLRGVGFNVVDLGINVAVDAFVTKVAEERPQVLALSALLTTTMPEMRKVIAALTQAGVRETVKVIVGGAPVNQNLRQRHRRRRVRQGRGRSHRARPRSDRLKARNISIRIGFLWERLSAAMIVRAAVALVTTSTRAEDCHEQSRTTSPTLSSSPWAFSSPTTPIILSSSAS